MSKSEVNDALGVVAIGTDGLSRSESELMFDHA